jgi:hypothetical protein
MIKSDRLRLLCSYDPVNGGLLWTSNRQKVVWGSRVGTLRKDGYRQVRIDGGQYREHRLVWLWHHGDVPEQLDHINGVRDDNRIENLRPCNHSQNQYNTGPHSDNTSGYRGVCFDKGKNRWKARMMVTIDGVSTRHVIGMFNDPDEAAVAYNLEALRLFGEFAKLKRVETPLGKILGMG